MAALTPICDFGWKAKSFTLPGVDGKHWNLSEIQGSRGTLAMFLCNHCPYVKAVIGRIVETARSLQDLGVGCVAIMSNDTWAYPEDSFENMGLFAKAQGFSFPYLYDEDQAVAKAYGAVCTPDFFGFNAGLELQYRGRLDDSRKEAAPGSPNELLAAMRQIVQTGRGPESQTPSMGCSIKWKPGQEP